MTEEPNALVVLNDIRTLLAKARDLTETLTVRDMAVAAHAWAMARSSDEAALYAMEIKLRAERKAGKFLIEMKERGEISKGGRPIENPTQLEHGFPSLKQLGIKRNESQRWQSCANIPDDKFEEAIASTRKLTQSTILRVAADIKRKANQQKQDEGIPYPDGIFDIIYADPPWQYNYEGSNRGKAEMHYKTESTDQIINDGFYLQKNFADNSILFLWTTNPFLEDALNVIKNWGFEYKTNFVWIKNKIGTGFYNRSKHELLLICRRGNLSAPADANRFPSVIDQPRTIHSKKPDKVYDMIEKMYPNRKYLELYARKQRKNWVSWGLEIGNNQSQ